MYFDRIYKIAQDLHVNPEKSCKSCKQLARRPDAWHPLKHSPDNMKRQLSHLALRILRNLPRAFGKLRRRQLLHRPQLRPKWLQYRPTPTATTLQTLQSQILAQIYRFIFKLFLTIGAHAQVRQETFELQ